MACRPWGASPALGGTKSTVSCLFLWSVAAWSEGKACPIPECIAPAAPGGRHHRAVAPVPAQPGWRTSHSPAPASPRPADAGSEPRQLPWSCSPAAAARPRPGGRHWQSPKPCSHPRAAGRGGLLVRGAGAGHAHLQDGPIDAQQHLPGLVPHAEDVLRQCALEQQVAEPPAASTGWSGAAGVPPQGKVGGRLGHPG